MSQTNVEPGVNRRLSDAWNMQVEVLRSMDDDQFSDFRNALLRFVDECVKPLATMAVLDNVRWTTWRGAQHLLAEVVPMLEDESARRWPELEF